MNELILRGQDRRLVWAEEFEQQRRDAVPWLRQAVGAVLGRWRLAAIVTALTFAIVVMAGFLIPRSQYAQATLVVHPVGDNLAEPQAQQPALPPDTSAIDTEVEILRSPAAALSVVKRLGLYKDPEFGGSPDARPSDALMRNVVATVQGDSSIRRIGLTYVVQIGFLASSIAKAKWIADGIINAYMSEKMDEKLGAIARANRDLSVTLGGLREQALQAQARVEDYKGKNNLVGSNGTSLMESELSQLNQEIAGAQADSAEKSARLVAALAQAEGGSGGSDVGATLASNTIGALRQREADASATLSQLQTQFQPSYPAVQKASAQLGDIRRQLRAETARILSSLRADAQVAARREVSLLASRQQTATALAANNRARAGLITLQQDADSAQKIYQTYLTRASEISAARSLQQVDATVQSWAIAVRGSFLTSWRFIGAIASALALVTALLAVFFSESWNRRIPSWSDVTRETGAPLAAVLPDVRRLQPTDDPYRHFSNDPLAAGVEAFRNLRAFLSIAAKQTKIIAVTSAEPGEGKTFTAVCLAHTLAASGSRVVLLDCDLRHASASKFFAKPKFGIAQIVERSLPLECALVKDAESGVFFLAGSSSEGIPGNVFDNERIDALLAKLSTEFDKVVIDTAPILGFADGRILASKADCVLTVVHWDKTPTPMVHAALEILRRSNAHVVGVVLNKVDVKRQARYRFADAGAYYRYYGSAYALPT